MKSPNLQSNTDFTQKKNAKASSKKSMKKWQVLVLIGFIITLSATLYMLNNEEEVLPPHIGEPGDPDEAIRSAVNYIKLTREYQIDLDKHAWRYNKKQVATEFFQYLNKISNNYFNFSYESHVEEGYHRYSFDSIPKAFGKNDLIVRERDYLVGERKGLTTIDFKFRDQDTMEEALEKGARPSYDLFPSSTQKVELDIHACDVRWSRGTRVFLNEIPNFQTVGDIAKLFPDITKVSGISSSMPLKTQGFDVYYWQISHSATNAEGLHYKTTITFFYSSIEEAFDDVTLSRKDGEFSFRLYADKQGYSREFNPRHEQIVEEMYEKLIWSKWNVDPELDCRERPNNFDFEE